MQIMTSSLVPRLKTWEDRLNEFLELVRRYDEANGTDPVPDQVKKACIISNTLEPLKTHLQLNVGNTGKNIVTGWDLAEHARWLDVWMQATRGAAAVLAIVLNGQRGRAQIGNSFHPAPQSPCHAACVGPHSGRPRCSRHTWKMRPPTEQRRKQLPRGDERPTRTKALVHIAVARSTWGIHQLYPMEIAAWRAQRFAYRNVRLAVLSGASSRSMNSSGTSVSC